MSHHFLASLSLHFPVLSGQLHVPALLNKIVFSDYFIMAMACVLKTIVKTKCCLISTCICHLGLLYKCSFVLLTCINGIRLCQHVKTKNAPSLAFRWVDQYCLTYRCLLSAPFWLDILFESLFVSFFHWFDLLCLLASIFYFGRLYLFQCWGLVLYWIVKLHIQSFCLFLFGTSSV